MERFRLQLLAGLPGKGRLFFLFVRGKRNFQPSKVENETMSKSCKVILLTLGGMLGFVLIALAGLLIYANSGSFKSRLETVSSNMLGMEVDISGKVSVDFYPGLHVTFNEVRLQNHGMDVATAPALNIGIKFWPLLLSDVRLNEIVITEPTITVTRTDEGISNLETTRASTGSSAPFAIPLVSLTDAVVVYENRLTNRAFQAVGCRLDLHDLLFVNANNTDMGTAMTFTSELDCEEIQAGDYRAFNLEIASNKSAQELDLSLTSLQLFGADGSGSVHGDFTSSVAQYQVQFSLPQFSVDMFFNSHVQGRAEDQVAVGNMDFNADLSLQGKTIEELIQSMGGKVSLQGENLVFNGTDLDDLLEDFAASQNFNLVDIGAFFYVGPLSLLLTKGYDYSSLLSGSGGQTEIPLLFSEWQLASGVAIAEDVAMVTKENRIALQGELDLVNRHFHDLTVALIDAEGCVEVEQKINGDFSNPEVEQPNILRTLAGPVISLLERSQDLISGDECEVFYAGTVAPPQ